MATHSSILAWKISWTEELGGLQSMESQRVKHDLDNDKNPQDPLYPFEPEEQPEKFVFRIYDHQTHQLYESPRSGAAPC